jgi:hypothetical protein
MSEYVRALYHGIAVGALTTGLLSMAVSNDMTVPFILLGIAIFIELTLKFLKEDNHE